MVLLSMETSKLKIVRETQQLTLSSWSNFYNKASNILEQDVIADDNWTPPSKIRVWSNWTTITHILRNNKCKVLVAKTKKVGIVILDVECVVV